VGQVIYEDAHVRAEERSDDRAVVITRSAEPLETPGALVRAYGGALDAVGERHRGFGLILDVRAAPGLNEPDFEASMEPLLARASACFACIVVVVSSAVGVLQVERVARAGGRRPSAVRSEAEALERVQALLARG